MIHRKKGRKLKRTASHRSALLSNLSISLILNKRIQTTEAKAKELRRFIEPLVSKAKKAFHIKDSDSEKSIHLRREARKFLNDKQALNILFNEIGDKVSQRPGGYTRVLKTGNRYGDGARTAIIEFVDYNYVESKNEIAKAKEDKNTSTVNPEQKDSVNKTTVKKENKKEEKKKEEKKKEEKKKEEKKKEEKNPKSKKLIKKKAEDN